MSSDSSPKIRFGPAWPEKCRPLSPREVRERYAQAFLDTSGNRNDSGSTCVISLYAAAKRIGLHFRWRGDWNPLLLKLCQQLGIDVRSEADGVPCMRESDLPSLERAVRRHLDRKPIWPRRKPTRKT